MSAGGSSHRIPGPIGRLTRLFHTVKYLKRQQITNRIWRKLRSTRIAPAPAPERRAGVEGGNCETHWITSPESMLAIDTFRFLNMERTLSFPDGWNDADLPKLWLYNLHYFDGLMCPGTAADLKQNLVARWIEDNPPGIGRELGNGWEPYPTSLRIVNWIKWQLQDGGLTIAAIDSLALQARYLERDIEYHLMGNHLMANAKALVFAGAFFAGEEGERWLRLGMKILEAELGEQFLADGAHFELSPAYHAIATEDLMDLIHVLSLYGLASPVALRETATRALHWASVISRPDGSVPYFNDSPADVAPSGADLARMADQLGLAPPPSLDRTCTDLAASGYFRAERTDYCLIGDAGAIGPDYIPGHAHCDMLSFELYHGGATLLTNTGVSTYETSDRRRLERETLAHNTVCIGQQEQSDVWAAFRVGKRASIISRGVEAHRVEAILRDASGNTHRRCFNFLADHLEIEDSVICSGRGADTSATASFHFHHDVSVEKDGDVWRAGGVSISFSGASDVDLEDYEYAAGFYLTRPAKVLRAQFSGALYTKLDFGKL